MRTPAQARDRGGSAAVKQTGGDCLIFKALPMSRLDKHAQLWPVCTKWVEEQAMHSRVTQAVGEQSPSREASRWPAQQSFSAAGLCR